MKILLIILFLLFTNKSYALGGKVYSIKLDNNNWIKEMPHIYPTADLVNIQILVYRITCFLKHFNNR